MELNGNTRYQILNSTGVSSLKWPEINGMYVFAATVVARDYRYDNNSAITHKMWEFFSICAVSVA